MKAIIEKATTGKAKGAGRRSGFTLVVTLSLMILLTVVAVGMLSLATISLRSSGQDSAASLARSNARLALMLALGELQATMGTDTSVSAPASTVMSGTTRPHLTGAWQRPREESEWTSWHWVPTTDGAPDPSRKASLFKRWLASSADPSASENFDHAKTAAPSGVTSVSLVGAPGENLANHNVAISVSGEKVGVSSGRMRGNFSWAVFDESVKAPIHLPDPSGTPGVGAEIAGRNAPARVRADVLDQALAGALKQPLNMISLDTGMIPDKGASRNEFRKRFHDFTTDSVGLLTDTAKGGLKTDLTSLFEPEAFPSTGFVAPTAVSPYQDSFGAASGSPSWKYLQNHYRKYKNVTSADGGTYNLASQQAKTTDLRVNPNGIKDSPDAERLLPVIAKFQMVFSLVAHSAFNVEDRREFLNTSGDPKGYINYGSPDLVYDPVITLYNPYDVSLNLSKVRIRIWDPPVGLRFRKIDNKSGSDVYFRSGGEFLGLGRFQITSENTTNARKAFTLVLADGDSQGLSNQLVLKPGEIRVFSPRVESNWSWGYETAGGASRTNAVFFDWDRSLNFGNTDFRKNSKYGTFGVECAPGWDFRAGLQTDHLSSTTRDTSTLYAFEQSRRAGWMNIRRTDEIVAEIKPLVTGNGVAHFQIDVLAGASIGSVTAADLTSDSTNQGVRTDTLRSYRFNFTGKDPSAEISRDPASPIISRRFKIGDIMQEDSDMGAGGKKAFAMLEMSARTTKDELTDGKPWLYNNFVVDGGEQRTAQVGLTHQSYDLRLFEVSSLDNFPDGISVDPDTKRGYFGSTSSRDEGSSFVNMLHVPLAPAASLGDLIPCNLVGGSALPRVVHPFGNSRAHPLIPADSISRTLGIRMLDHSYLLNDALWDSYFFSSIADYATCNSSALGDSRPLAQVLEDLFDGTKAPINSRLLGITTGKARDLAEEIAGLGEVDRSRQIAKYLGVGGPFNVNSTSVDAWRAVLSSFRDRTVNGAQFDSTLTGLSNRAYPNKDRTPFVRAGKPLGDESVRQELRWAAFRQLTDGDIDKLAGLIVVEIVARGEKDKAPSLSLGEFVNRRPGSQGSLHCLAGLLQTALDKSDINKSAISRDSKSLSAGSIPALRKTGVANEEVLNGNSAEGAPTLLTQGDLMAALSTVATVRGDTFKIRAYGESTSADGSTVAARAWCEAVVQRVARFVDPTDVPETAMRDLTSAANRVFGRRFEIVSFRWLNENEL